MKKSFTLFCYLLGALLIVACNVGKDSKPSSVDKMIDRSVILASNGQIGKALVTIDSVIAVEPKKLEHYNTKFNFLLQTRDFDRCITHLNEMHRVEPNNAEAFSFQGYIYEKQGEKGIADKYYEQAIAACKTRIANNEDMFKNYANMAFLMHFYKNKETSVKMIDSLIARHPDNDYLKDQQKVIMAFNKKSFLENL